MFREIRQFILHIPFFVILHCAIHLYRLDLDTIDMLKWISFAGPRPYIPIRCEGVRGNPVIYEKFGSYLSLAKWENNRSIEFVKEIKNSKILFFTRRQGCRGGASFDISPSPELYMVWTVNYDVGVHNCTNRCLWAQNIES